MPLQKASTRTPEVLKKPSCRCRALMRTVTDISRKQCDPMELSDLSPKVHAQVARKLLEQEAKRKNSMSGTKPGVTESSEQQAVITWVDAMQIKYPELEWMYHVPNEGKRSRYIGNKLKKEGLKPGVPDLCLPVPKQGYIGLYIEMKRSDNKPTDNQMKWLKALAGFGHYTIVCYSAEEAIKVLEWYVGGGVEHDKKVLERIIKEALGNRSENTLKPY